MSDTDNQQLHLPHTTPHLSQHDITTSEGADDAQTPMSNQNPETPQDGTETHDYRQATSSFFGTTSNPTIGSLLRQITLRLATKRSVLLVGIHPQLRLIRARQVLEHEGVVDFAWRPSSPSRQRQSCRQSAGISTPSTPSATARGCSPGWPPMASGASCSLGGAPRPPDPSATMPLPGGRRWQRHRSRHFRSGRQRRMAPCGPVCWICSARTGRPPRWSCGWTGRSCWTSRTGLPWSASPTCLCVTRSNSSICQPSPSAWRSSLTGRWLSPSSSMAVVEHGCRGRPGRERPTGPVCRPYTQLSSSAATASGCSSNGQCPVASSR